MDVCTWRKEFPNSDMGLRQWKMSFDIVQEHLVVNGEQGNSDISDREYSLLIQRYLTLSSLHFVLNLCNFSLYYAFIGRL